MRSCDATGSGERIEREARALQPTRKLEPLPFTASVDITVDVSWTGDLPNQYLDRPAPKIERTGKNKLAGVERPAFERHNLPRDRVAVRIWTKPKGPPGVGFVVEGSVTGMAIETDAGLPLRTQVQVELAVPGGYTATLSGRVVRTNDRSIAIHLDTEDSTWQFRSSFLELARRTEGQAPTVVIRTGETIGEVDNSGAREATDFRVLGAKWHEVLANLTDDAVSQEFIQECLRCQRLEFALERYRELKDGPDDAIAARYLGQIGVILGFMSLKKKPDEDKEKRARMIKLILLCVVLTGALLLARELFVTRAAMSDAPPPAAHAPRLAPDPPRP